MILVSVYLLVNAAINPYYGSFLTGIGNCIYSCLHRRIVTTSICINTKHRGCVSVWGRKITWKIITNGFSFPFMMRVLFLMVMMNEG